MLIDLSYKAIIEGLLFIAEAPMSAAELAKICEIQRTRRARSARSAFRRLQP